MNHQLRTNAYAFVSAGCHINDVMNYVYYYIMLQAVSAGCHINDVMNDIRKAIDANKVSAGCHINDVMNML